MRQLSIVVSICVGPIVLSSFLGGSGAWAGGENIAADDPTGINLDFSTDSSSEGESGAHVVTLRDGSGVPIFFGVFGRSGSASGDGAVAVSIPGSGTPGTETDPIPGAFSPAVATDGGTKVVVAGTVGSGVDQEIVTAHSSDSGETWSTPKTVTLPAKQDTPSLYEAFDEYDLGSPTAGALDFLIAVFGDLDEGLFNGGPRAPNMLAGGAPSAGTDADIAFMTSSDDGATWTTPIAVNSDAFTDSQADFAPEVLQLRDGTLLVAWHGVDPDPAHFNDDEVYFARSTDLGVTWSPKATLDPRADDFNASDGNPRLAEFAVGKVIAVWESISFWEDTVFAGSDADIVYSISLDSGATWAMPLLLNTNALPDVPSDTNPAVVVDAVGRIVVVWEGRYYPTSTGTSGADTDMVAAISTDMGATWTDPVVLNSDAEADTNSDFWPSLAALPDGTWLCAWTRFNTSTFESDVLSVTFRVTSAGDIIFVDFGHMGTESGIEAEPFNTLGEGLTAVNPGGTIRIAPGSSPSEMPTINQVVTLENSTGAGGAIIGGTVP